MSRIVPQSIEPAFPHWIVDLPAKDPAYIAAIHGLPCCVCVAFGLVQTSPTQAHHVIHDRYGRGKTPDGAAIPLCMCHHQGDRFDRDKSKLAIHRGKQAWRDAYGADYSYTASTRETLGYEWDRVE